MADRHSIFALTQYEEQRAWNEHQDTHTDEGWRIATGDLVDFGAYRDVVTDHDTVRDLNFYIDLGQPYNRYFPPEVAPRSLELTFGCSETQTAFLRKSVVED